MVTSRLRHALALALAITLVTSRVCAAPPTDRAGAEALFVEGRAALDAGRLDEACAKLESSQRLEPAAGTLLNLADCEERRGRVATAWEGWRHALDLLPPNDDRRPLAEQRAKALEKRLPRIGVKIEPGARVLRDGTELPSASLETPLPVDPGPHEITVVRGERRESHKVLVAEGESRIMVFDLGVAPGPSPTAPAPRIWPLVTGGGALVALTLGTAAGLAAAGRNGTMDDHCTSDRVCDPVGLDAGRDGKTYATVSTVSFVAAGALVATTVFLLLRGR